MFEKIGRAALDEILATNGSTLFRRARFDIDLIPFEPDECAVHRGPLFVSETFRPPAFATVILGDLTADGLVDLSDGDDEGGLFFVFGNVACAAFANGFGRLAVVDGNLEVDNLVLNAFEDSALTVTGNLRTHFFYGLDIWAEVGGVVEMTYGDGYCLPIGYTAAAAEAITPKYDRETSLRRLAFAGPDMIDVHHLLERLRAGAPIFKPNRT